MTRTTDQVIGANLARLRGDRTQSELATAMRGQGHKWSQATVWKVETGERPLRLVEALALANVLGLDLATLTGAEDEQLRALRAAITETERQQNRLRAAAHDVEQAQRVVQAFPDDVVARLGWPSSWAHESALLSPVEMLMLDRDKG